MQQRLLALRRADQPAAAARDRLVGQAHDGRAAFRAARRHHERAGAGRAPFDEHADHLRNHVAGAADDHGVADAHVLAPHLVLVVQRRIGDGDAADEHRLEARDGGHRAGATHLHVDAQHLGRHLLGRKLVRDGEARCPRHVAQLLLLCQPVDLVDDPVDIEGQRRAAPCHRPEILEQALGPAHHCALGGDRKLQRSEAVQQRLLRRRARGGSPVDVADAVGEEGQTASGGDPRIELPQCAGGGVARIDEQLVAPRRLRRIERREITTQHQHLAAHLRAAAESPGRPDATEWRGWCAGWR